MDLKRNLGAIDCTRFCSRTIIYINGLDILCSSEGEEVIPFSINHVLGTLLSFTGFVFGIVSFRKERATTGDHQCSIVLWTIVLCFATFGVKLVETPYAHHKSCNNSIINLTWD